MVINDKDQYSLQTPLHIAQKRTERNQKKFCKKLISGHRELSLGHDFGQLYATKIEASLLSNTA